MHTNNEGLALIKAAEGLRLTAYQDSVGVWTIGYGHTSAAGSPAVRPGMHIELDQAETILKNDLVLYEDAVTRAIKVPLTSDQFSALVSLCYNIGPGNFAKSSVVRAVNAKQFQTAAHRFGLFVKAGGKTLPGLVKRRAAEAALFLSSNAEDVPETDDEPIKGKSMMRSSTNGAAVIAGGSGVLGLVSSNSDLVASTATNARTVWDSFGHLAPFIALAVIIAACGWIVFERWHKSKEEGV